MSKNMLFVDMNAFFASVEQQERPELRGKPVLVAPIITTATCVIAASYEAKQFGISTGTNIGEALRICPQAQVVEARPPLYVEYHKGILNALDRHIVHRQVLSVDEMACVISDHYATRDALMGLAQNIKREIQKQLGPCLRSSVGIAPNIFLAKVASDFQKPDGLTILEPEDIPNRLLHLKLTDLPGIAARTEARLQKRGIHSIAQLYALSAPQLRQAWGSVVGERWWHMLRGSRQCDYGMFMDQPPKSIGHSHVLGPNVRTPEGAEEVLTRLFTRAMERMRRQGMVAGSLYVSVSYRSEKKGWASLHQGSGRHTRSDADADWLPIFRRHAAHCLRGISGHIPIKASLVFGELIRACDNTGSLFASEMSHAKLSRVVDSLNRRFGESTGLAKAMGTRVHAPPRIAFGNVDGEMAMPKAPPKPVRASVR
jgi:DNA polymerase-4